MNRSTLLAATATLGLLAASAGAAPVVYTVDTTHSSVVFYVNHFGFSNSIGRFKLGEGTFSFDNDNWSNSTVDAKIPVPSLQLGDAKWNEEIIGATWLDSAKYPDITFVSHKVEKIDAMHGKLSGDLTVKGVTKPVVLDVTLNKIGDQPIRKTAAAGFTATTTIKRSQFGVAAYVPAVADELVIRIEVEAFVAKK